MVHDKNNDRILPVFRPPLDFNISTNHLYSTGQAVTGVNVVFYLVDKLKKYYKGDMRPFDEGVNAELKRYPISAVCASLMWLEGIGILCQWRKTKEEEFHEKGTNCSKCQTRTEYCSKRNINK
jgi:hypothetical protein